MSWRTPKDPRRHCPTIRERTAALVDHVTMPAVQAGEHKATVRRTYLERLRDAPAGVLRLKLADRYSNVQRLHTHPRPAKQRSYYAETVEHFVPLADIDDRLAELFHMWAKVYAHLDPA
jgi:(p)ppGpp synthase/HD superfamily hydrolase